MDNIKDEIKVCFTAFVDILGYSEMIKNCNNNYDQLSKELAKIKTNLIEPQNYLNDLSSHMDGRVVNFFSDSVFINVPLSSISGRNFHDGRSEIGNSLDDLASYQFNLAQNGYFIRGCATINYAYFDESIAFGSGILEVVECEKNAKYPRICLTDSVMETIEFYRAHNWPGHESISSYVCQDDKGKFFLNYLQVINDYIDNCSEGIPADGIMFPKYRNVPESVELMSKHKKNIENNIQINSEGNVKEKYIWLANYHNFFCQKFFEEEDSLIIEGYNGAFSFPSCEDE